MMMKAVAQPKTDLKQFLEIVLMWHKAGDVPRNRGEMSTFIEDVEDFSSFLMSVLYWTEQFGLRKPTKADIVKTLYQVLDLPSGKLP